MKFLPVLLMLSACAGAPVLPAYGQESTPCLALDAARKQEAAITERLHLAKYELSADEIRSFNAFLDERFTEVVDIVTLFVFPDGHAVFTIGSTTNDLKCSTEDFALSPEQTQQLLRVVKGVGA